MSKLNFLLKRNFLKFLLVLSFFTSCTQNNIVTIENSDQGSTVMVNGKNFMINGLNWDYIPIGTNTVTSNFWNESDEFIAAALDEEMNLVKKMGVNTLRQYSSVPPKWIKYIFEEHGIYTMINHSFGRYGLMIDDAWVPVTNYADPKVQAVLLKEVDELVAAYKNTPGILLYLLGNENNYGLFWEGAATEDIPIDEKAQALIGEERARPMYHLMNKAALRIKANDTHHPVAICNGDILFIDIIAEECTAIDIYGTNTYRGVSFGDIFQVVKDKLNLPILFTEFGADAYNAITQKEDQASQAYYMVENWKEIYNNAAGLGKVGNSLGGFTFQFSDGWWKFDQSKNLDLHDPNASWANGGYMNDYQDGANNMNEEWFGICAKVPNDTTSRYTLVPRKAYYALQKVHQLDLYDANITLASIADHFSTLEMKVNERN